MPKTVPTGPGLEPGNLPFSTVVEAEGSIRVDPAATSRDDPRAEIDPHPMIAEQI